VSEAEGELDEGQDQGPVDVHSNGGQVLQVQADAQLNSDTL